MSPATRTVPAWAVVSATLAPVVLTGGWTVAADRQPGHFDAARRSISSLAAHGATDRWIMTLALAVLGACHIVTALGLCPVPSRGRWLLAIGGASTLVVAASPQPAHGSATVHIIAATAGFVALALWPLFAADDAGPLVLRRRCSAAVTVLFLVLLGWLTVEIGQDGALVGASERVLAGAQACWPLVVVLALRVNQGRTARMVR